MQVISFFGKWYCLNAKNYLQLEDLIRWIKDCMHCQVKNYHKYCNEKKTVNFHNWKMAVILLTWAALMESGLILVGSGRGPGCHDAPGGAPLGLCPFIWPGLLFRSAWKKSWYWKLSKFLPFSVLPFMQW